jgi:hypothetical protein
MALCLCSPDGTAVHHEERHETEVPQPIFEPRSSCIEHKWVGRPVRTASIVFITDSTDRLSNPLSFLVQSTAGT